MEDKIAIKDAGIVILTNFIPTLFERLGLTSEGTFRTRECQERAVLYLQYLIRGTLDGEELLLPLNKLLCGLGIEEPIEENVMITKNDRSLMEKLIDGAIAYWPSLSDSTVSRFRVNWLIREGLLEEHSNYWKLTVENNTYDILLSRSPYTFSAVKYPWMDKVLEVHWSY